LSSNTSIEKKEFTYDEITLFPSSVPLERHLSALEYCSVNPILLPQLLYGGNPTKTDNLKIFHGPPGTGKTLLARALACNLNATFIKIVASAIVDKYIGESARLIREMFGYARDHEPCVIFMDEIDAIGGKRQGEGSSADREIQRTLMELLNQLDGFEALGQVKIVMATNRPDILDPALLRPGRLDRKIDFPLPDRRQKRLIFSTITGKMNLSEEVDLEDYIARPDKISGADINAICQEAVMQAVRENRYVILSKDFEKGYKNNITVFSDCLHNSFLANSIDISTRNFIWSSDVVFKINFFTQVHFTSDC
jgi:ATP-dependent 26S proteasome regulatory subunit